MPVPSTLADLSATLASNSPDGSEAVFPQLDNYLRAGFGLTAQLRDKLNGTDTSAQTIGGNLTVGGSLTVTGATALNGTVAIGDAAGDTLIINPSAVSWPAGPTHSGNHTWSGTHAHSVGATFGNTARADTSTLDWYEENTFTPAYSGATVAGTFSSLGTNVGRYTRIGDRVFVSFTSSMTVSGSPTGTLQLQLPYAGSSSHNQFETCGQVFIYLTGGSPSSYTAAGMIVQNGGGTYANFRYPVGTTLSLISATGATVLEISGSFNYKAA